MKPGLCVPVAAVTLLAPGEMAGPVRGSSQATLQEEVRRVMKDWMAAWERLDLVTAMHLEADTADYLYIDADGSQHDKAGLRRLCQDQLSNAASEKIITRQERTLVLGPEEVLYTWYGAVELTLKNGSVQRIDPCSASFILRRIRSAWKIVYQQESSRPPQIVKPADDPEK